MKKSLVLAMAMALGVTASAYAANPFSDVPAGHWAYDSISKLAAAGVIEGYGDTTFGGDKLMTRYEMAQIVAKAMAKGANCDKLAAEFADELDNLGVRVANLEKKADNVKITGQIRYAYADYDNKKGYKQSLRTRLFVKGQINEDWTYTARLHQEDSLVDNAGDDKVALNWAYVTGKVGGVAVEAGRQDFKLHTGYVMDTRGEGIKASYGKDIKLTGMVLKASSDLSMALDKDGKPKEDIGEYGLDKGDRVYVADVSTKLGAFDVYATYFKADTEYDNEIINVGFATKLAKDLKLSAEYMHGDINTPAGVDLDNNGYAVGLAYKGASAAKAGSYGVYANYFDQAAATYLHQTITSYASMPGHTVDTVVANDGFKGFEVGANYAVAKNIVAGVKYYDIEAREGNWDDQTLWGEVVFTF